VSRKVIFGGAVSLDGYFAGPGESIDWLRSSDDSAASIAASWKGVDTMLAGAFFTRSTEGPKRSMSTGLLVP
jgi:hypothetical protein